MTWGLKAHSNWITLEADDAALMAYRRRPSGNARQHLRVLGGDLAPDMFLRAPYAGWLTHSAPSYTPGWCRFVIGRQ